MNTWAVMTDELQVVRLATSIAEGLSPVPTIHGTYYAAHSQLYPLLLSPFYGTLSPPDAATAAHVLNVVLLVSAAVPAYYLARATSGSDAAGCVAAALTAVTPWLVLSSTLLTENAAYAAFTWCVLLCQRAVAHPSRGHDAAALAGLALAFFARTQLFVGALALPVAIVLHEAGYALRSGGQEEVRTALRAAVGRHRVLVVAYLAGGAVAILLAAAGQLGGVVGNYVVPFEGDLVPSGLWSSAAEHLDQVVLGVGVVPAVLTASWLVTTAVHPERRDAHAFGALVLVLCPVLVLEVTSFDLRFTPEQFIQDRYLFYLVPLFAVGCTSWLALRGHLRTRLIGALAAGAVLVGLLALAPDEDTVIFWAAPAGAFRPALGDAAAWTGLGDTAFIQIVSALAVFLLVLLTWRTPRVAFATTASVLVALGAFQALYVFERSVVPSVVVAPDARRDWIDRAVPGNASVALVPGGRGGPVPWWEAEFWNRQADRELRVGRGDTFTPFPAVAARVDERRGRLLAPEPSDYLVVAAGELRFGLAEARTLAARSGLLVRRVKRPYRLLWTTRGLTADGWMVPGEPASVRVFGHSHPGRRAIRITFASSQHAPRRIGFEAVVGGDSIHGTVDPGGARPPVDISVCVPAGGSATVDLRSHGRAVLEDGRTVSLHLERVTVSRAWPCRAF